MLAGRQNDSEFSQYNALLIRFGMDYRLLDAIDDANKKAQLKKLFEDLQYLIQVIGAKESTYALMNWADVFFAEQEFNAEAFFTDAHQRANDYAKKADSTMTMVYLGLNALGFILSVLALPVINVDASPISVDPTATGIRSGWNYVDTCGGIVLGIKQIYQGEVGLGMVNLASSLQLAGCTIAADLGKWCSGIHMASATMAGLTGFSFAACMFVSGALEFYEVYKADERISKLQEQYDRSNNLNEMHRLEKAICIEKAQRENHLRSAKSWMACGVAMTLIAVAGYCGLSVLSMGALPMATAVFAGAALITGLIRKWWVSRVDHVANLKIALKKPENAEKSLNDRLQKCLDDNAGSVTTEVTVPGISIFGSVKVKFKDYLQNMLLKDPAKLGGILKAYEEGGINAILPPLQQHRNCKLLGGFGKTTGERIHAVLMAPAA